MDIWGYLFGDPRSGLYANRAVAVGGMGSPDDPSQGYLFGDPAEMRRRAISEGLMRAGGAMLAQGPTPYPQSFMQGIGRGLLGFSQGAQEGRQDAMREGFLGLQAQGMRESADERKLKREQEARQRTLTDKLALQRKPAWFAGTQDDWSSLASAYPEDTAQQLLKPPDAGQADASIVQEYNKAVAGGFKGSMFDYRAALAAAGRAPASRVDVKVNTGPTGIDYGDPPKDMAWARNADGSVHLTKDEKSGQLVPMPIPMPRTSLAGEEITTDQAAAAKAAQEQRTGDVVVQDVDRGIAKAQDMPFWTTGFLGGLLSGVGGTAARDVAGLVQSVKANVSIDRLQAMRAANKTGGALGNVSDKDMAKMESALGTLDQSQSSPQFIDNLSRVKNVYLDIVWGAGNGPPRDPLGFQQPSSAAPARQPSTGPSATPAPSIKKQAIDPLKMSRVTEILSKGDATQAEIDEANRLLDEMGIPAAPIMAPGAR